MVVLKALFALGLKLKIHFPIGILFSLVIKETARSKISCKKPQATILALNPARFRGDLEVLADTGDFKVLILPFRWSSSLVQYFYKNTHTIDLTRKLIGVELHQQAIFRRLLKDVISLVCKVRGIDCVIGANINYKNDYDWGAVCHEQGIPFVVFHRECLITNKGHRDNLLKNMLSRNTFHGTHIITQNEITKNILVESGYIEADNISALGSLRMDAFINKIKQNNKVLRKRKLVTFFSFCPGTGVWTDSGPEVWPKDRSKGLYQFFEGTHLAFVELAIKSPDVDFVIKTKLTGMWFDKIDELFKSNKIEPELIPNLSILFDVDPHDLMLESDVIVSFGSTTLIESAISKKAVIMPLYDEASYEMYEPYIQFGRHKELFLIAKSKDELLKLINSSLDDFTLPEKLYEKRLDVFEEFVSDAKGRATEKYVSKLLELIDFRKNLVKD